jgi:hypothetical protein
VQVIPAAQPDSLHFHLANLNVHESASPCHADGNSIRLRLAAGGPTSVAKATRLAIRAVNALCRTEEPRQAQREARLVLLDSLAGGLTESRPRPLSAV